MKIQTFKTAILLVVITLLSNFKSQGQSWTTFSYTATSDTVLDQGTKCVYDGSGNSYWAGRYYIAQTTRTGYILWKLDRFGVVTVKQVITTGVFGGVLQPIKDLKVIAGNLYVLFDIKKTVNAIDYDVCTQKYDFSLVKKWESIYNNPNSKDDFGVTLCEGPKSGILTSVSTGQDGGIINNAISNGAIINSYFFGVGNNQKESIRKTILTSGGIYFAGKDESLITGNSDMFITKVDTNLSLVWNKIFDASGGAVQDEAIDINSDASGDILVTGNFVASTGKPRVFYTKYNDVNGSRLWIRRLINDDITAVAVFANSLSNVISVVNGSPCRYVNINGTSGAIIASKGIFTSTRINYQITDCINGANDLYITGTFDSTYSVQANTVLESGVILSKLDGTGSRLWNKVYSSTSQPQYTSSDLAIRGTNRLCFIVNVNDPSVVNKATHCIFSSISTSSGNRIASETTVPTEITLYPNPAKDFITIRLNKNIEPETLIEIYNYTGQLISRNTAYFATEGSVQTVDISGLSAGTYLLRIQSGDEQFTQTFIAE
jgi:hypothetical protein